MLQVYALPDGNNVLVVGHDRTSKILIGYLSVSRSVLTPDFSALYAKCQLPPEIPYGNACFRAKCSALPCSRDSKPLPPPQGPHSTMYGIPSI